MVVEWLKGLSTGIEPKNHKQEKSVTITFLWNKTRIKKNIRHFLSKKEKIPEIKSLKFNWTKMMIRTNYFLIQITMGLIKYKKNFAVRKKIKIAGNLIKPDCNNFFLPNLPNLL